MIRVTTVANLIDRGLGDRLNKPAGYAAVSTIQVPSSPVLPPGGAPRKPEMPDKLKCTFESAVTAVSVSTRFSGYISSP